MTEKAIKAIERIKFAYKIAKNMGNTLIVAYSGGKDSDVLLDLATKSGVPFKAEHNHTTVDAPPTVYHIREVFAGLTAQGIQNRINYPDISMWKLIEKHKFPPTKIARYCCAEFKERRFEGQHLLMGIRWAESSRRKKRGLHETIAKRKEDKIVYMDENDEKRKLTDICTARNNIATNPIIDWSDGDIWRYIRENGLKVNPLYSMGYKRVGCVGCPMSKIKIKNMEFEIFPKYKAIYLRTFERMIEAREKSGMRPLTGGANAETVLRWWLDEKYNPDQIEMEFDEQINKK